MPLSKWRNPSLNIQGERMVDSTSPQGRNTIIFRAWMLALIRSLPILPIVLDRIGVRILAPCIAIGARMTMETGSTAYTSC